MMNAETPNSFAASARQVVQRRAERYLQHFDSIWKLQRELLSEADASDVPIISNDDKDIAIRDIMTTIVDHLEDEFTLEPREVFTNRNWDGPPRPRQPLVPDTKPGRWRLKKPATWFRSRRV